MEKAAVCGYTENVIRSTQKNTFSALKIMSQKSTQLGKFNSSGFFKFENSMKENNHQFIFFERRGRETSLLKEIFPVKAKHTPRDRLISRHFTAFYTRKDPHNIWKEYLKKLKKLKCVKPQLLKPLE